jgi:hypothetical protein
MAALTMSTCRSARESNSPHLDKRRRQGSSSLEIGAPSNVLTVSLWIFRHTEPIHPFDVVLPQPPEVPVRPAQQAGGNAASSSLLTLERECYSGHAIVEPRRLVEGTAECGQRTVQLSCH